jgi:ABC-type Mn2+/Zn2+ transport system permease subunit
VIQEFIASWALFQNTYLVGWLIGLLLALVGVLVVARDQIFIGAAVSQASTLGIALALGLGSWTATESLDWFHADAFLSAMAVAFSVLAALLTARGGEAGNESHEAVTGWVFLAAASGATLIVSHSPHGLDEIHRLLSSSIIGATPRDIWTFSALAIVTDVALVTTHRRVLLFTLDPAMAAAVGMRLKPWALMTSAWLGCRPVDSLGWHVVYLWLPGITRPGRQESLSGGAPDVRRGADCGPRCRNGRVRAR